MAIRNMGGEYIVLKNKQISSRTSDRNLTDEACLIIVNYNNLLETSGVIEEALEVFPKENIVFVDDGSEDDSWKLAEDRGLLIVRHAQNQGVGAALRTGLEKAADNRKFRFALAIASNGKMSPHEAGGILRALHDGAEFVQGSRYLNGTRSPGLTPFRQLAIPVLSLFISVLLKKRLYDVTCGYRGIELSLIREKKVDLWQQWLDRYELESYLLYKVCRGGYKVVEVPVTMKYTHFENGKVSKIRPIIDWWSILRPYLLLSLGIRD